MDDTIPTNDETTVAGSQKRPATLKASPRKGAQKARSPVRKQAREKPAGISGRAATMTVRATRALGQQPKTISTPVERMPARTASTLGVVGILGFLLGVLVGRMTTDDDIRRRWH